jgi:hypothetical protein
MGVLYSILMYSLAFGAITMMFGTLLGIAFWLLKTAWRFAAWLLLDSSDSTMRNDLQNARSVRSYRI